MPAEVVRPGATRSPAGLIVRTDALYPGEVTVRDKLSVTTEVRTAFDHGRLLEEDAAIVAIDDLCNATKLDPADVLLLAERHPGIKGVRQLRRVIAQVDGGAASPPETMTRLLIKRAGLPAPQTQVPIRDRHGFTVALADMGWRRWRLVVEYDGAHHWQDRAQRTRDIDRYQVLKELGWTCVRVDADLLNNRPQVVLDRIHSKLAAAGAPVHS